MSTRDPATPREQWTEKLLDGTVVLIRPISKADAALERSFIAGLSMESRYFRFLDCIRNPSLELLEKLVDIDRERAAAYAAVTGVGPAQRLIGVSRYNLCPGGQSGECAVVVSDEYQHKGLGTLLMRHLIELARARGVKSLFSIDAASNRSMWQFAAHLGFHREVDPKDATLVVHRLELQQAGAHI
jgi:GNAT superfamily N-acetyltransferase